MDWSMPLRSDKSLAVIIIMISWSMNGCHVDQISATKFQRARAHQIKFITEIKKHNLATEKQLHSCTNTHNDGDRYAYEKWNWKRNIPGVCLPSSTTTTEKTTKIIYLIFCHKQKPSKLFCVPQLRWIFGKTKRISPCTVHNLNACVSCCCGKMEMEIKWNNKQPSVKKSTFWLCTKPGYCCVLTYVRRSSRHHTLTHTLS